jgi:hypothetical protein
MFSMTLCFDDDGPRRPARDQPARHEPVRIHVDGAEHREREEGDDEPAERDEHVVDRQFAREPDEVHARTVGEPATSDVREADRHPQGNWQVQNGQHLSVTALAEGEDVGEHSPSRERQRQQEAAGNVRPALPQEIDRQQREHEQAGVPGVEQGRLGIRIDRMAEQRRHLDGQGRGDGKTEDDERLGV